MRSPRRTFAAPFVITLASACSTAPPPPHPNPPGPQDQPEPVAVEPAPPTNGSSSVVFTKNPPAPHLNPPPPPETQQVADAPQTRWMVDMQGGKCHVYVDPHCPHGKPGEPMPTCNPPPPMDYACPPGSTEGKTLMVVKIGEQCQVEHGPMSCPPKAMCNPPPPRIVPCPPS